MLCLMLLKTQPGSVAGVSGLVHQRPGTIIFLFSSFAANAIHFINAGRIVFRCRVIENPQALSFVASHPVAA
jgi:hypothetical protein